MRIVIAQVHENLFNGDADELSVPTTEGVVTILANHEPFVATLNPGTATIRKGGEIVEQFTVESGVLEVSDGQATVLL